MKNFTIKEILPNVYRFNFKNQYLLARHFIRFQEHYESPAFRDRFFTLEEYELWYMKEHSADKFTYYGDWNGFNVPSYVFDRYRVYELQLNDFERAVLDALPRDGFKKYYVIGTHGDGDQFDTLEHEIAHALYTTHMSYKIEADRILFKYKDELEDVRTTLLSMGYHPEVIDDECQAYMVGCTECLDLKKVNYPLGFKQEIQKLFKEAKKWLKRK